MKRNRRKPDRRRIRALALSPSRLPTTLDSADQSYLAAVPTGEIRRLALEVAKRQPALPARITPGQHLMIRLARELMKQPQIALEIARRLSVNPATLQVTIEPYHNPAYIEDTDLTYLKGIGHIMTPKGSLKKYLEDIAKIPVSDAGT